MSKIHDFERVGPGRYRDECPTRESDWDTEEEGAAAEAMSDPYCGYEPDTEADEDLEQSRERLVYIGQDLIVYCDNKALLCIYDQDVFSK